MDEWKLVFAVVIGLCWAWVAYEWRHPAVVERCVEQEYQGEGEWDGQR